MEQKRYSNFGIYVACAVFFISSCLAILIIGAHASNPKLITWMSGDFITMQFAWDAYRNDNLPAISLKTVRTSWPLPISVALFDVIPIVALLFKLLSSLLPEKFQYFGPLFILNAGLQGLFAFLLFRESSCDCWTERQRNYISALAAILVATTPILYGRFKLEHPPLTAHWLIIAGLWLYVWSLKVNTSRTVMAYAILLLIAAGINPYLLVMVTGTYFGFLIRLTIERRWSWITAVTALLPFLAAAGALVFFGFLDINDTDALKAGGYGIYSANLNSLINPYPIGSTFLPSLPTAREEQNEGYGYLGLGAIIVVLTGFLVAILKNSLFNNFSIPLLIVASGALVIALSTSPSFGTVVSHYEAPEKLYKILEIFRSSGRFIWVTHYIFVILSVTTILKITSARNVAATLTLVLIIQAIDLFPAYKNINSFFSTKKERHFKDIMFTDLGNAHQKLIVTPPWQCGRLVEADYPTESYEPVSFLAMDNNLVTNSFYSGRLPRYQKKYHCDDFPLIFPKLDPDLKTAYLFTPRSFIVLGTPFRKTHLCDYAENFVLCRADQGIAGLSNRAKKAFYNLTAETEILLYPADSEIWQFASKGFEHTGAGLSLTGGEGNFLLASQLPTSVNLEMEMSLSRHGSTDSTGPAEIFINGMKIGSADVTTSEKKVKFFIPAALQSFGILNVSIVDLSSELARISLKSILFREASRLNPQPDIEIEFTERTGRSSLLMGGWSDPEKWGVWSDGEKANLFFPHSLIGTGSLQLDFTAEVFLKPSKGLTQQRIIVSANGLTITEKVLNTSASFHVKVPDNIIRQNLTGLLLSFDFPDRKSPSDVEEGADIRNLALGLKSVIIRQSP